MPKPQPTNYSNSWLRTKASTHILRYSEESDDSKLCSEIKTRFAVPHARDD
ncbi:hypothetical protein [Rubritalea tangerina]|uniref:hypothetical protein n=1 Tax=Rubritalea tangerina TaxID=430798 RepID=UPI00360A4A92